MKKILPCLQKVLRFFLPKRNYQIKLNSKRFSDVESCATEYHSPVESTETNEYIFIDENDADKFIVPQLQAQIKETNNFNNLTINHCNNCKIRVLQTLENAFIDNTYNCTIFVGPCKSTLFIRNCKNIKIKAITQQLRIENSTNISIEAITGVKPVMEGSKQIKLGSLELLVYNDLIWQMELAEIDPFKNKVFQCFDFTPQKTINFELKSSERDEEWQQSLKKYGLISQKNVLHLPKMYPIKSSLISKNSLNKLIEKQEYLIGLIAKIKMRQLLAIFNNIEIEGQYCIIINLDEKKGAELFSSEEQISNQIYNQKSYYLCLKCDNQSIYNQIKSLKSVRLLPVTDQAGLNKFFSVQ